MTELKELMLKPTRRTLAVAESLTCGRVQARIGSIPGASEFFLGGLTAYSLDQKVKHLGVDRAVAAPVNSVSAAVAEQMAQGVCALFGSELGLATTGYAETFGKACRSRLPGGRWRTSWAGAVGPCAPGGWNMRVPRACKCRRTSQMPWGRC